MTAQEPTAETPSTIWGLGDYHRFATEMVWELGARLVDACGIEPGQRVLDVAAGSGNTALRAAEAGAGVVASDLTTENFEAGRREASARGVELEWVQADAQALPFGDGGFDVVTSSVGALFAPDQRAVAGEMLRVCRPGGTIGMINFTPDGTGQAFFEVLGRYSEPLPPGAHPPTAWGSEDHVRELFGDGVQSLTLERDSYVESSPGGPAEYCEFFKRHFGPVIALREALTAEPDRLAALDREFLEFATRENRAAAGERAEYVYDYLLVVARRSEG